MTILAAVETAIVSHARATAPAECCGLLLGHGDTITEARPARNIADDTFRRYLIDPADHLAAIRDARGRSLEVDRRVSLAPAVGAGAVADGCRRRVR